MIELQNITKIYGQEANICRALNKVTLNINQGEFIAIMGASGSGKSTLMNILGALDQPTSGHYLLKEKDISKYSDDELAEFRNKKVGFVFQQFNLLPRTSVFDNVALPGLYGQMSDLNKRVNEVLEIVQLEDKTQNKSNELSGGQIQRVAIARALLMEPAIVMADEPTGNLDSKTAYEIMDTLAEIHKQGNTIILVTHEHDIATYAQRVITLKDGEILSDKLNKKTKKAKQVRIK